MTRTVWIKLGLWWAACLAAGVALDRWMARHYGNIDWAHEEDE